jgi:hypothetical protein
LTAARTRLPLKIDDVIERLREALGLSPAARGRLRTAYRELEAGQLDPGGVDERVWQALHKILRVDPRRLLERPKPAFAAAVYMRTADMGAFADLASRASASIGRRARRGGLALPPHTTLSRARRDAWWTASIIETAQPVVRPAPRLRSPAWRKSDATKGAHVAPG